MTEPMNPSVTSTRSANPVVASSPAAKGASVAPVDSVAQARLVSETLRGQTAADIDSDDTGPLVLNNVHLSAGRCHIAIEQLTLPAGDTAVLSAPVGSGKTTFLRAVVGVQQIDQGTIHIGSRRLDDVPPEVRQLGWVPQGSGLLPTLTVREQIAFPLVARGRTPDNVDAWAEHWGVASLLDRRPDRLSGGEQQLVALARATIVRPVGLLLDEPFASLSEAQRTRAIELLRAYRNDGPPIWAVHVTHHPEHIHAEQVWTLTDGFLRDETELRTGVVPPK